MKVTNEIRIHGIDGQDTKFGDGARLLVLSSDMRRRGVSIQLVVSSGKAPSEVITVDGDELRAAIDNAVNLGG